MADFTPERIRLALDDHWFSAEQIEEILRAVSLGRKLTHGRHCICSACAREDWTNPKLAPCGVHGPGCPAKYQPLGMAGQLLWETEGRGRRGASRADYQALYREEMGAMRARVVQQRAEIRNLHEERRILAERVAELLAEREGDQ